MVTNPGLLYLPGIEQTSAAWASATDGGTRGANIVSQLVKGGVSATPLWPWPHEARIRADLCATAAIGLCQTSKTLTQYIWEYLGATAPAAVLGQDGGLTIDGGSTLDAGTLDAGTLDAGTLDAGTLDAGTLDAGTLDAGDPAADAGTGRPVYTVGCDCGVTASEFMPILGLCLLCLGRRRPMRHGS